MDVAGVSTQRPRTFLYWNENFFFVYFVARLPSWIATGKCIYIEAHDIFPICKDRLLFTAPCQCDTDKKFCVGAPNHAGRYWNLLVSFTYKTLRSVLCPIVSRWI